MTRPRHLRALEQPYQAYIDANGGEETLAHRPRKPIEPRFCLNCSKELVYKGNGPARYARRKYCGPECQGPVVRARTLAKPSPTELRCPVCGVVKPHTSFPLKGTTRYGAKRYGYCQPCASAYQRVQKLRRLFNLSPEDYETMLSYQKGVCAICSRPPKTNRLAVDHDHKTGLVRGLVCWSCNQGLGFWAESIDRMAGAVVYLHHPPASRALGGPRYGRKGRTTNKAPKKRKKKAA